MNPYLLRRLLLPLLMLLSVLLAGHPVSASSSYGTLCGVVFSDRQGDGKCDSGDTLLCGVTVTFKNSSGATCGTATTNGNGQYTCSGLKPGNYTACVPSSCAGQPVCSYNGATCVYSGQCTTKNFCYQGPGSICGVVSTSCGDDSPCSNNGSPICGVPVTIKNSSGATSGTATTDSNGKFNVGNLTPGNYTVQVPTTFNGLPVCSYTSAVSVKACQCATDNICYQGPGTICGLIFYDTNGNCIYNFCDPLLCGVPVSLVDANGHTVATTTSCFGLYFFCSVAPGHYTVQTPATYCGLVLCPCDTGVTVAACQTACDFLCYQCPPPPPGSISITLSANYGCVVSSGTSVTYTYVVKNTSSVTVKNITVTDSVPGSITPANFSLASGASQTLTKTVTLSAATDNTATAAGTDTSGKPVSATSNTVSVKLSNPSITVSASATPPVVTTGAQTTINYVVTNTGDETLNNITVTDSVWGTVGTITSLASHTSQTLPLTVTPGVGTTPSNVSVTSTAICSGTTVTASTTATVTSSNPGLTITANIPHACIQVNGGSIAYTYTVTNSGNVPLNGVTVTDSVLGISDSIGTLAVGGSTTNTDTITLTASQIANLASGGTITTNTTATGTDSVTSLTVSAASAASLPVTVIHPSLGITYTDNPTIIVTGQPVDITYTVKNTGDTEIDNITVTDGSGNAIGSPIASLPVGQSASVVLHLAQAVASTTVTATGSEACGGTSVTITAVTSHDIVAPATISGTVVCSTDNDVVPNETVQLIDSNNNIVQTTTTDSNGAYEFDNAPNGTYTVKAGAGDVDHTPASSAPFAFTQTGSNVTVLPIGLTPTPIVYEEVQEVYGAVFFSNSATFQSRADANIILSPSDLYNGANAFGSAKSFRYVGTIPHFEELGTFGTGMMDQHIWVIMNQPLLPENSWNNYSLTNQVGIGGVVDGIGTPGNYTYRLLFNQPFDGPGTAYNYTLSGLTISPAVTTPYSISLLPPVYIGGGTAPAMPAPGDIPAGWMAQGMAQYVLPPGVSDNVTVDGSYDDACGDLFQFHIHPLVGDGPDL